MNFRILGATCALALSATAPLAHAGACNFPAANFSNLDHGLYWFKAGGNGSNAIKAAAATNPNFDPTKPTIIYIHGWQKDSVAGNNRECFERPDSGSSADLSAAWRNAGWNTGIFYWNQFSDEGEVKDAEAKIWSTAGPKGMRWRNSSGAYSANNAVNKTAAQLFLDAYKVAMANYSGSNVRLVGHSLGSQMVIVGGKLISDAVDAGQLPANTRPKRIALLDPAFLQDGRPYLNNRWTGEVARDYVDALKGKGVIFEALRSSGSSSNGFIGDANNGLMVKTAFRELKPWYFNMFQFGEKHGAAVWHYLWEVQFNPAVSTDNTSVGGASASDARVQQLMNDTRKAVHNQGAYSKTPADDTYSWANK